MRDIKPVVNVRLVIYKILTPSEIKGFYGMSNRDQSAGGGQRDLRWSQSWYDGFHELFKLMAGEQYPMIAMHWADFGVTYAKIAPPTNSRPNEFRLATTADWIPKSLWPNDDEQVLFIMVLDVDGEVWPYIIRKEDVERSEWEPLLRKHMAAAFECSAYDMKGRQSSRSCQGYIDYEHHTDNASYGDCCKT